MELITKENYDVEYGDLYMRLEHEVIARKDLTHLDKLIYAIIKNRFNLSIDNNYINKNGEYFVYFSQKEISEIVSCSERSVRNTFKRLQAQDKKGNPIEGLNPLIKLDNSESNTYKIFFYQLTGEYGKYKRKTSSGQVQSSKSPSTPSKPVVPSVEAVEPSIEVVKLSKPVNPSVEVVDKSVDNMWIINEQTTPFDFYLIQAENEVQREQEVFSYANEKFSDNEEKFSSRKKEPLERQTKKINNKSIYLSSNTPKENSDDDGELKYRQILSQFKEQIDYSSLLERIPDKEILDDFCMSAIDMLMSTETKIEGQKKPLSVIQSVLSRLTHFHIEQVIDEFCGLTKHIGNVTGYMKTMLYNIAINCKAKLENQVRSETYGVA